MSSHEDIEFLKAEIQIMEDHSQLSRAVSSQALKIVRTTGILIGFKPGLYGGREGLIGSARPGTLIVQATEPLRLGESGYVSLRNRPESTKIPETELVELENESDWRFVIAEQIGERVLARFTTSGIELPEIEIPTTQHIQAVSNIIDDLEAALEPVSTDMGILPRVDFFSRSQTEPAVYNIRELQSVLANDGS